MNGLFVPVLDPGADVGLEGLDVLVCAASGRLVGQVVEHRSTDGTTQRPAEQLLSLSAHLDDGIVPVVFFSTDVDGSTHLTLGRHRDRVNKPYESNEFAFSRRLDTLAVQAGRLVDNAGLSQAGRSPKVTGDHQLFDGLLQELPDWLAAAHTAHIVQ